MFELSGCPEADNPIIRMLDEDARRHPLLRRRWSFRSWLSRVLARASLLVAPDPLLPERYALIAEWCRYMPVGTVLSLTVSDLLTSTLLPDGSWRFLVDPTKPVPDWLRSRTRQWYRKRHNAAFLASRRSEIFIEPTGYATTAADLRREGIRVRD